MLVKVFLAWSGRGMSLCPHPSPRPWGPALLGVQAGKDPQSASAKHPEGRPKPDRLVGEGGTASMFLLSPHSPSLSLSHSLWLPTLALPCSPLLGRSCGAGSLASQGGKEAELGIALRSTSFSNQLRSNMKRGGGWSGRLVPLNCWVVLFGAKGRTRPDFQ